jgi:hypothetical protein
MLALPPVAPVTGWRSSLRLPRDHFVRMDGNDYSVHPSAIGRRVEVAADLDRVQVLFDGRLVADHARSWARHQTFTDPAHAEAATALRREHRALTAARALRPADVQVEQRPLSSYDTAFGLADDLDEDLGDELGDGPLDEPGTLSATGTTGASW